MMLSLAKDNLINYLYFCLFILSILYTILDFLGDKENNISKIEIWYQENIFSLAIFAVLDGSL